MKPDTLTPKQQLALWSLASRGGSALLSELPSELEATDRRALERLGIVESRRDGRAMRVELGDAGWRALGEIEPKLVGENERRVPAERRLLEALLLQFTRFMRAETIAAAQVFGPVETKAVETEPTGQTSAGGKPRPRTQRPRKAPAGTARPASPTDVEAAIRTACREIAGDPARQAVRLSVLRAKLPDSPRERLDAALLAMRKAGSANLMNLDNPRDIAPEREAALTSGLHTFHVVWIDQ